MQKKFTKSQKNALDLVNRKDAEIEKLKAEAEMADGYADALIKRAKTEAIKKVAAELYNCFTQYEKYDRLHIYEILDRIDNIEEFLLAILEKK